jgi:hypothetical protein
MTGEVVTYMPSKFVGRGDDDDSLSRTIADGLNQSNQRVGGPLAIGTNREFAVPDRVRILAEEFGFDAHERPLKWALHPLALVGNDPRYIPSASRVKASRIARIPGSRSSRCSPSTLDWCLVFVMGPHRQGVTAILWAKLGTCVCT